MDSWCVTDVAGNVSVVIRLGVWDSVRIISWRCDLPERYVWQGSVMVNTRRRIVFSSTVCVYNR